MRNRQKHRWKFVAGKERYFVYAGLAIAYVLLIILVSIIHNSSVDKLQLEMKFESEKSFNSVYMALNESKQKALATMATEKITAVGIYGTSGNVFQSLGDAPEVLPIGSLALSRQKGDDSTLGFYVFNSTSSEIEYFRLSRFIAALEIGVIQDTSKIGFVPEILYVRFDGSQYYSSLRRLGILMWVGILLITLAVVMILNIYLSNRHYRMALEKNESLARLGSAARTLTHEIKNPLSALTIQSALMKKTLPREYYSDLDIMEHEIQRLTNLTNRVSEFLKNPTGNPERIEIISFIKDIVRLFPEEIPVHTSNLENIQVLFDIDRARSVFENLIKNACESTDNENPYVEVSIRKGKRSDIIIDVLDRGKGLGNEPKEKLFDPFFTTKIHGSGIGLSISRQFVQAQGGSLKLYSREGGGTVAEVILPCAKGLAL